MIDILRINIKYRKSLSRLSDKDKAYILDGIFEFAYFGKATIKDDNIGDLLELINSENELMCIKAIGKAKYEELLAIGPMVQPMVGPMVQPMVATKVKESKVKEHKVKESKVINISKEIEQSSKIVKEDKRVVTIDLIIETLKELNGGIIDDKVVAQRRYGKHIQNKLDKINGFKGDYVGFIKFIYENSDDYRKQYFRSAEKFYYNIAGIIAGVKTKEKTKTKTVSI